MLLALEGALADCEKDENTAVVVLTGADPYYCAGVNLSGTVTTAPGTSLTDTLGSR